MTDSDNDVEREHEHDIDGTKSTYEYLSNLIFSDYKPHVTTLFSEKREEREMQKDATVYRLH